jgi:hypothetical protein
VIAVEEIKSAAEVVAMLVDILRRSDAEYCAAHRGEPVTDEEWNEALEVAEDWLEDIQELLP